jgi:hypothetical protein
VPSAGDGQITKVPEGLWRVPRAALPGARPPLGQLQDTPSARSSASVHRLGPRICLRKGCGHTYQPRHWKQRYCQESECLKEVRRWQAAKRQQRRRERPEVRRQRAAEERERRARQREQRRCQASVAAGRSAVDDAPETPGAWSRKAKRSEPFCDRVGCYETLRSCSNGQARYCGEACRRDVARVRDRERKWLARKTLVGRFKRHLEYRARRARRALSRKQSADPSGCNFAIDCNETVLLSRNLDEPRLSCRDSKKKVTGDDRETYPDRRSRPPPSS